MSPLAAGKLLETVGAVGLAYVGIRAAIMEIFVGRHAYPDSPNDGSPPLTDLQARLAIAHEFRRRQFGFWETIIVGAGTAMIAIGCAIYLCAVLVGENAH